MRMRRHEAEKLIKDGMDDRYQGKYSEALDKFDSAIKGLAASDEEWARLIIGEAMHQLGVTLQNIGKDFKAALSCLWSTIAYRQLLRDSTGLGYTYFQIPMCRLASGEKIKDVMPDFMVAQHVMIATISLAAQKDDFKVLGDMWHNAGYISQIQESFEDAYAAYDKALMYRRKSEDERGRGLTLARLAECSLGLDRISMAKLEAHEALKIFRKIGDVKRITQAEKVLEKINDVDKERTN